MGKLLVTNNKSWHDLLHGVFCDVGFKTSFSSASGGARVIAYQKLSAECDNAYCAGNDFVVSTGTMFYKGQFGREALQTLLFDAQTDDTKTLRSRMIGSYAVVLKTNGSLRIFVDETHTYDLYYYVDSHGRYVVTNTFFHVQKCARCQLNDDIVLERGVRGGVLSCATPFRDIYSIGARDVFEVDLESGSVSINSSELNSYPCDFRSKQEAVNTIWSRAQAVAELRARYLNKSLYFVTGGVDSRVELSAAAHNAEEVSLGYWMGSDCITNGTNSDLEIQTQIADELNLSHKCYEVGVAFEDSLAGLDQSFCDKFGELASIYCGNPKWFNIFENLGDIQYVGFGFFGETIRPIESIDLEMDADATLMDFIKRVYCRTHIEDLVSTDSFYETLVKEAGSLLPDNPSFNLPIDHDDCARLFGYSRFSADCALSNLVNMYTYSFPLLGTKQVSDAIFSLPYSWKADDQIAIGLISKWNRGLLDIPVFSHHHHYKYDGVKGCLLPVQKFDVRARLKGIKVLRYLYRKYIRAHIGGKGEAWTKLFNSCRTMLQNSAIINNSDMLSICEEEPDEIELATLATFVAQLKVLEYLMG